MALAGLMAVPLSALPSLTEAATKPGYPGRVYYHGNEDGDYNVYAMNADGTSLHKLTTTTALDQEPVPSPDGSKVTFASNRDGNNEIYVMDANGNNQTRLTTDSASDSSPAWSPDGTKIAFHSNRTGSNQVWVIDADGSNPVNLSNDPVAAITPDWSPDGTRIVYRSSRAGGSNPDIYVMNADGSHQSQLTTFVGIENDPSWSPDGQHIFFARRLDATNYAIFSINASGGSEMQLTATGQNNFHPQMAPNQASVTFTSLRDGNRQIYMMDPDGSNQTRLTNHPTAVQERLRWQSISNTAPATTADAISVRINSPVLADVLANDTDEEALSPTNLALAVHPNHGTASILAGQVSYTPTAGYVGADQLSYQICDSFALDQKCGTAVLGITVTALPPPSTPTDTKVGNHQVEDGGRLDYTGHRPTFSGTSEPDASIRVEINSDPIVLTTTAGSDGNWSVAPNQDIPAGDHTVTIAATKDGQTSAPLTFVLGITSGAIPNTGADTGSLRLLGLGLLVAGSGLLLTQRRLGHSRHHSVPSLFP